MKQVELDAARYQLLRRNVSPYSLVCVGLKDLGELQPDESIAERIDRMVDEALQKSEFNYFLKDYHD